MRRKSQTELCARPEFVVHIPTGRAGVVVSVSTAGTETYKTIRLAEGELVVAVAREFRLATDLEIEGRHRVAALVRPLALPTPPTSHTSFRAKEPGPRL